jgi:hypothetical protein
MAGKRRSKRQPDGELVGGRWEGYLANQGALEQALGVDGAAMARQRAEALREGGWAACWDRIE